MCVVCMFGCVVGPEGCGLVGVSYVVWITPVNRTQMQTQNNREKPSTHKRLVGNTLGIHLVHTRLGPLVEYKRNEFSKCPARHHTIHTEHV